jgi:integrase/recombinase XerD
MSHAIEACVFFRHIDSFVDYRLTVYEASEQTTKSNITDLMLFKRFVEAGKHDRITGPVIMDFQRYLKEERTNCGSSINRKIFSLKSYGKHLALLEVADWPDLPFHNVLKVRQGYRCEPGALTVEQVKILFDRIGGSTCLGIRDYAVFALMYNLGLRVGEVYNLSTGDIDFEKNSLTVTGKGRKRRSLPLSNEMKGIMRDWLSVRNRFLNHEKLSALFISKKGNRLAIRTMEDNFKKLIKEAGLSVWFNITCHTLRHSFASHLNDKDTDILVLQSLLGHSTPRSTEIYIHPSIEKQREAIERLPVVKYVGRLLESGVIRIRYQKKYKPRVVVNRKKLFTADTS